MARQNDSDFRSNIADIDHTPHRNRQLTVFHNHLRTSPAIPIGLVDVWPAHLLYFCHPVLRIKAGDSLLLSESVALLDLISEDWSSILQPRCVS